MLLHLVIVVVEPANLEVPGALLLIGDNDTTSVLPAAGCSHKNLFMLVV